jgi:hypothetical protein
VESDGAKGVGEGVAGCGKEGFGEQWGGAIVLEITMAVFLLFLLLSLVEHKLISLEFSNPYNYHTLKIGRTVLKALILLVV